MHKPLPSPYRHQKWHPTPPITFQTLANTNANSSPRSVSTHICVNLSNRLYFFGGYDGDWCSDVWCIELLENNCYKYIDCQATTGDPQPTGRAGHAATQTSASTAVVFGGCNRRGTLNDFWHLEAINQTTRTPITQRMITQTAAAHQLIKYIKWRHMNIKGEIPSRRKGHSITKCGEYFYIFGGGMEFDNAVYRLDIDNEEVRRMMVAGEPPKGTMQHSMTAYGGSLFLVGGISKEGETPDVIYEFNTRDSCWTEVHTVGTPISMRQFNYPTAVLKNNLMYCLSGNTECEYEQVYVLNLQTKEWRRVQTTNELMCRFAASIVMVDDDVYVYGGLNCMGNRMNELVKFELKEKEVEDKAMIIKQLSRVMSASSSVGFNPRFTYASTEGDDLNETNRGLNDTPNSPNVLNGGTTALDDGGVLNGGTTALDDGGVLKYKSNNLSDKQTMFDVHKYLEQEKQEMLDGLKLVVHNRLMDIEIELETTLNMKMNKMSKQLSVLLSNNSYKENNCTPNNFAELSQLVESVVKKKTAALEEDLDQSLMSALADQKRLKLLEESVESLESRCERYR